MHRSCLCGGNGEFRRKAGKQKVRIFYETVLKEKPAGFAPIPLVLLWMSCRKICVCNRYRLLSECVGGYRAGIEKQDKTGFVEVEAISVDKLRKSRLCVVEIVVGGGFYQEREGACRILLCVVGIFSEKCGKVDALSGLKVKAESGCHPEVVGTAGAFV